MTVPTSQYRSDYVGNGVTSVYSFGFKIYSKTHVKVIILDPSNPPEVQLVVDVNYSVQGVRNPNGGTITLLGGYAPLPSGFKLVILLNPPLEQNTDIKNNDAYYLKNAEDDQDKRVQQTLSLKEALERSLKIPFSVAPSEFDPTLPPTIKGASRRAIVTNEAGDGLEVGPSIGSLGAGGGQPGDLTVARYSGNGVTTAFTLPVAPVIEENLWVFISGVYQQKDTFSVSGTTLTFSSPPPVGVSNIEVVVGTTLSIGTPADGTVSTPKIVDGAVTLAKLANSSVDASKLAADAVETAKIKDKQVTAAKLASSAVAHVCDGRLTLATATPVTTADQTAKSTVYFTPYKGNRIALYDGTDWRLLTFAELSIAVPNQASKLYDVFAYINAGVVALELSAAWASDTARTDALALQNGVYVKSGTTTRRYLGTFRTTTAAGETEDSLAKRYVWNYYNRVTRLMQALEPENAWTYNTVDTWRQANANSANQLDFVVGINEERVKAEVQTSALGAAANAVFLGIGLDSTTVSSAQIMPRIVTAGAGYVFPMIATYQGHSGIGRHFLAWLEATQDAGGTTFYGDSGFTKVQCGIVGEIMG